MTKYIVSFLLLLFLFSCNQNPIAPSELYEKDSSTVVLIKNEANKTEDFDNKIITADSFSIFPYWNKS